MLYRNETPSSFGSLKCGSVLSEIAGGFVEPPHEVSQRFLQVVE